MDPLAFVLALAPILWLVVALLAFRLPAWKAAAGSFAIACALAMARWGMGPAEVATASLEGFLMALWPIVLVIVAAVFTYNLCVSTGAMDVIGRMIASVSSDRRILALLIAWCFGGFMEGMAGFGTAVAIPAGMLAGMGFDPLTAVLMCLVANGVPTAFGSIGIPTVSLAGLVGLDANGLAFTEALQLSPFYVAAPFLIALIAGRGNTGTAGALERLRGVAPVALASGASFAAACALVAALVGPELAVVVGSLCSLAATAALGARAERSGALDPRFHMDAGAGEPVGAAGALRAWSCFILIFVLLLGTSKLSGPLNAWLAGFSSTVAVYCGEAPGSLTFSWVNTPGVWIFAAAVAGGLIQGAGPRRMLSVLAATLRQMAPTAATMLVVLGCAKVMGYAGMISDISAFCIGVTGALFPLAAPWIGAVGAFVTGSGTSSAMLFGPIQLEAATALGTDPYWMVALNELGVAAGKMLSPQTLAIGLASVRVVGRDAELLRAVLPYALGFLIAMSALALAGAWL